MKCYILYEQFGNLDIYNKNAIAVYTRRKEAFKQVFNRNRILHKWSFQAVNGNKSDKDVQRMTGGEFSTKEDLLRQGDYFFEECELIGSPDLAND